ncbi:SusC/RagA family TonB-linked outer membrane protein [Rhodohalobacter sp. 614A]|uniref:SusC/RagA family TonB-linked outer membrane protein n=1 Tax=Rhodohalobacter sp. 614A TaxID=2908649 RepID=UPI001F16A690|nr:SusC/RagA family TonB-linked outer membrane protein [Rhodohalobacter sp. 614A]
MKLYTIPALSFLISLCFSGISFAQTGNVTGTVTDTSGEPLPGVNIVIQLQARSIGASTDLDGVYTIEDVPARTLDITARFVGFSSQTKEIEVLAGETITVDFELGSSTLNLNEVVVTGTAGPVQRQAIGHSVSSVSFDDVESTTQTTLQGALSGKVPSVSIAGGGTIDQEPRIRIRGTSSISMSNQPLVYVDGIRVNSSGGFAAGVGSGGIGSPSALAGINFDAIERIEILKGPAAATLYGSQASSGVIQIFTKQGLRDTPPQFDIKLSNNFIQMPDRWNHMTGIVENQEEQDRVFEYTGVRHELYEPFKGQYQMADLYDLGMGQEISATVRGGGETVTYSSSVRYSYTDGPFNPQPSDFNGGAVGDGNDLSKRLYFNGDLEFIPSDDFRIRLNTAYTNSNYSTYNTGIEIYSVTNSYGKPERIGTLSPYDTFGHPFAATPREASYYEIGDVTNSGSVSLQAHYIASDEITLDATIGVDYRDQRSRSYSPFGYAVDGLAPSASGDLGLGSSQNLTWSFETKASWIADFTEALRSSFVMGVQGYAREVNSQWASGTAFSGPGLEVMGATASQTANSSFQEVVDLGVFAQEQIDYEDWVYLTVGLRLDASSAFGSDFDYATYPKVSLSLLPFDALDISIPKVSTFRLRGAWGQSGQQPSAFDQFTTFSPVNSPEGSGVITGNLGDPSLKPEVATEWELGFEMGLFNDRVGIQTTYWDRKVKDALIARTFAPSGGFVQPQLTNAAELEGKGLEIEFDTDLYQGQNFSLNVFASAAYLWEQVKSLGGAPPIKVDATYVRDRMYVQEGYAPGVYFGAMSAPGVTSPIDINRDGIPDSQGELETYFSQPRDPSEFAPSYIMVAGPDGEPTVGGTGYLGHYLGKPTPDWEGSFGFSANFLKNFNLSTRFQYATGNYYHHNLTIAFRRSNAGIGRNYMPASTLEGILKNPASSTAERVDAARTWAREMVGLSPFDGLNEVSEADYIRWSNLSISYNLPATLISRTGLRSASITASGNNLALWTKYNGVDPTATGEGSDGGDGGLYENFGQGMDTYAIPLLRTYSLSLNVGF